MAINRISVTGGIIGSPSTVTVVFSPGLQSYYSLTLTWECDTESGSIGTIQVPSNGGSKSLTYTFPLSLASQNVTGTTVPVSIVAKNGQSVVYTYTYSFAIPASVKPSVYWQTVEDAMGHKETFGGYIQGVSKLNVAISVDLAYGSAIQSKTITFDGRTYTNAEFTTPVIQNSGTLPMTARVTDGRGRTGTNTVDLTVLPYSPPVITKLAVHRCNADGTENISGSYAKVTYSYKISSLPHPSGGGDTVTFDGNTDGKVVVDGLFVKVSEAVPTMADFANGAIVTRNGLDNTWTPEMIGNAFETERDCLYEVNEFIYIIGSAGMCNGWYFPEPGVYFNTDENIERLTINSYTGFGIGQNAKSAVLKYKKQIDSNYTSVTLASAYSVTDGTYIFAADDGASYEVVLSVADTFSTNTRAVPVSTANVQMHWNADGTGIAFGKICERSDAVEFGRPMYDKFGALIGNGLAAYNGGGDSGIDPDTTLEELCLTSHSHGPKGLGTFYYILTVFYNTKSVTAARAQFAFPYKMNGSTYHRYFADGAWSPWQSQALEAYPVGSYYIANHTTSPASLFGGTWHRVEGRIMYGCASSGTVGATGNYTTGSGSTSLPYVNVALWRRTA